MSQAPRDTAQSLATRIRNKQATIGVIGLGYVGLPVACVIARSGFTVRGIDLKTERVDLINCGVSPIEGDEPGLEELLARVVGDGRFSSSTDYATLREADVVLINVETPVDENNQPRYVALQAACASLAKVLQPGAMVICESTIAPGTMDRVVQPILEKGTGSQVNEGFYLIACPERVMPGKLLRNLSTMSRVIGASSAEAAEMALALYRHFVEADLDVTDCVTAELVKTAENAYRDVQIAFANEVALICQAAGSDVWRVRELVNKSPYRQMHLPGAGVGGHCIPKDPWLLAHGAQGKVPLRLIPAARAINDGMPNHVADMALDALTEVGISTAQARVVVLGYAYLENADDARNTPTEPLVQRLRAESIEPIVHDPFIAEYATSLVEALEGADCIILMVKHQAYLDLDLSKARELVRTPILIDSRNALEPTPDWTYRLVGRAIDATRPDGL